MNAERLGSIIEGRGAIQAGPGKAITHLQKQLASLVACHW